MIPPLQNKLFLLIGEGWATTLNTISLSTVCGERYLEGGPSYGYSGGVSEAKGKQVEYTTLEDHLWCQMRILRNPNLWYNNWVEIQRLEIWQLT